MKRLGRRLIVIGWGGIALLAPAAVHADDLPDAPRIDSVVMLEEQPHERDGAVIWYDDFDGPEKAYTESSGGLDGETAFGGGGKSMPCLYRKGERGEGNRKVFFGDSPAGKVVRPGDRFDDVYWRIYVKHQRGWTGGGPDKMSRATSIVSGRWNQAMIAHVWSSGEALTLDPATGVRGGRVVTTRYNDFDNLRWLGNRPASEFEPHDTRESGYWICIEARAKLNTPGEEDGLFQLWIDGRLEAERTGLDWRGDYTDHGINAVFLEAYWNDGSPVTQKRWYDNFVISTEPIGPVACGRNPVLIRASAPRPDGPGPWQAELASDPDGERIVWRSEPLREKSRVRVHRDSGEFLGALAGASRLAADTTYHTRARRQRPDGTWSNWSRWHQPFHTAESP